MTTVNFAELLKQAGTAATSNNYEPLPDGDYELKVIEAQATTTQTGKLMFKVTNEVQGGAHDKRRVWDQLVITADNPKAMNMFFMKANAMGLGKAFWEANPTPAQVEQAMQGRSFRGTLGTRTYNGNQSNEIKKYFPSQGAVAATTAPVAAAAPAPAPAPAPAAAPAPAVAPAPAATPFDAPPVAAAPAPAPVAPVSSEDTPF
jgi:hypothetical protein